MHQEQDIRSSLLPLFSNSNLGLLLIALVADVVASDARFNDWMAVDGKQELSDEEMLETIDIYEDARVHCIAAIERFSAYADLAELETALRKTLDTLRKCQRN